MSDRLWLMTYERKRRSMVIPNTFSAGKNYREEKVAQIDDEIFKVIEEAPAGERGISSQRRNVLDEFAHFLPEKGVVQGKELREMLFKSKPGIPASLPEQLSWSHALLREF